MTTGQKEPQVMNLLLVVMLTTGRGLSASAAKTGDTAHRNSARHPTSPPSRRLVADQLRGDCPGLVEPLSPMALL
jgi:hypothetical protein